MSKYADIEQIKEVIRTEWVKYMPMDLDVNLSFVLGKIAEVPTIEVSEDCISRDWVLNRLTKYQKDYALNELDDWQNTVVEWITMDINDAPSVVVRNNRTTAEQSSMVGEWKPFDRTWGREIWACSVCEESVADMPTSADKPLYDFCPHCGAKMK